MKNKRRITGIAAAVLCAIIGTISLVAYVNSAKNEAEAREALTEVYVVDKPVPEGSDAATIKASVSSEKVPNRLVQPGAVDNLKDVSADAVATSDLQPGDQLVEARVAPKNQAEPSLEGKVQVSAQLTADRAVGGTIAKGDTVGVYLSFDGIDQTPNDHTDNNLSSSTHLELAHVLVTNVQTTDQAVQPDEGNDDEKKADVEPATASEYIVTLALEPLESERFVFATEFGHVWLSDMPATVSADGTQIITFGNVYTVVP